MAAASEKMMAKGAQMMKKAMSESMNTPPQPQRDARQKSGKAVGQAIRTKTPAKKWRAPNRGLGLQQQEEQLV